MRSMKILCIAVAGILPLLFTPRAECAANALDGLAANPVAEVAPRFPEPDELLGIPYRPDGTLDEYGRNTLFANPEKAFTTPGLNCSGFVLAASRAILGVNLTVEQAKQDRQNDSGPQSPLGQDWDFGLDLILNISEGRPRRILSPDGPQPLPAAPDGLALRGFNLDDAKAWKKILPQMRPKRLYLATISKPASRKGYKLLHYHVGLATVDETGRVWWRHATPGAGVHRLNLNSSNGMAAFQKEFTGPKATPKKILIIEVDL